MDLGLSKRDVKLLESNGFKILSQKPIKVMETSTGSVATGICVAYIMLYLSHEKDIDEIEKQKKADRELKNKIKALGEKCEKDLSKA